MKKLPIQEVLNALLSQNDERWHIYLKQNWRTIIGDLHTRVCLEDIKGSTLILGVYDVHWMQELYLLSTVLIDMVNGQLEKPYIKQVRLLLVQKRPEIKKSEPLVKKKRVVPVRQLTDRHTRALAEIKDAQLQQIMQQLLQMG